jgi:hypothetical protein
VADDVCSLDPVRVKNADHVADRVLDGIRSYSFRAIGAAEATHVRRDYAKTVCHEERDLVAPKIRRIRPPVEQEHRPTFAVVLHMK